MTRPDPTARVTAPQKSYTSLGRGDSTSVILYFPNTGRLKSSAASSSGPDSGRVLWCHYRPAAGGWDACTSTRRSKHDRRTRAHTSACPCLSGCVLHLFTQHLLCQSETPLFRIYGKATTSPSSARALGQTKGPCPLSSFFFRVPSLSRGLGAVINRMETYTA